MRIEFKGHPTDAQKELATKNFESSLGKIKDKFNELSGYVCFDFTNSESTNPKVTWDIDRSKCSIDEFIKIWRLSQEEQK